MTRLLGILLLVAGCGDARSVRDAAPVDAHTADRDAVHCGEDCNPIANSGCNAGERCGTIVPPQPCLIACVPAGTIPIGGGCVRSAYGTDDCVESSACVEGVCRPFCFIPNAGCDAGVCEQFDGGELPGFGVCR